MRSISTEYSPNPQQKVISIFSFIIVFVFDCFELESRIANGERSRRSAATEVSGLVNKLRQLKTTENQVRTGKNCNLRTFSREYDCLAKIGIRKRSRCYWETRSNVNGQHEPTQTDNQRQKYMRKKTNKKTRPFVAEFWL